jgi:hypothetical protein
MCVTFAQVLNCLWMPFRRLASTCWAS